MFLVVGILVSRVGAGVGVGIVEVVVFGRLWEVLCVGFGWGEGGE